MKKTLLVIKHRLDKWRKWCYKKDKSFWPKILFLIGLFVLILFPLASAFSIIAFHFPWLPGFLIPSCLGVFLFLVVLGFGLKRKRRNIWKAAKYFLVFPICFCGGAFLFGGACGIGSDFGIRMVSSKARFPLAAPLAIAVDSKERVYCLSRFYNRVQVFDSEGKFLRGWFVGIPKGSYRMSMDEHDHLRVATERWGTHFIFDANGTLLDKTKDYTFFDDIASVGPIEVNDVFGSVYKAEDIWLSPKVVKISPSGEATVLIYDPFGLWVVTVPFPAFAFLMGSIFLLFILSKFEEKQNIGKSDTDACPSAVKM